MIIQYKYKNLSLAFAAVAFCAVFAASGLAQEREYINISPPGAPASSAGGINARGDIVGTSVTIENSQVVYRGFLRTAKGAFVSIEFPGADGTDARGIGPNGEIVGTYWYNSDPGPSARGYLRTAKGEYLNVKFDGSLYEIPQRILPDGTILGCKHDMDTMTSMKGVTWTKSGTTAIDAFASMNNGATPSGHLVVGLWFNDETGRQEGYTITNGVFESFLVPGSNLTAAWDVNPDGVIVGAYRIAGTSLIRGFARLGTEYETIHYPGSTVTRAFGINAAGNIVGTFVLGGKQYSYLAKIPE